jgi:basic membrane lipoprotein Med (substrate-binding protein (PBP1-ABC) superfamily)
MPSEINIATGENIGAFKYIIVNTGSLIQVMITLDRNVAIVSADYYDLLKAFYQQMIDKQNEKIVLKKI